MLFRSVASGAELGAAVVIAPDAGVSLLSYIRDYVAGLAGSEARRNDWHSTELADTGLPQVVVCGLRGGDDRSNGGARG